MCIIHVWRVLGWLRVYKLVGFWVVHLRTVGVDERAAKWRVCTRHQASCMAMVMLDVYVRRFYVRSLLSIQHRNLVGACGLRAHRLQA